MTESLDPRNAQAYRRRARVIVLFGLAGMVIGTCGVIDPALIRTSSAAEQLTGPVDTLWLLSYALGGMFAACGVWRLRPELEVTGDYLLMAACGINAAAILVNRGPIGGGVTSIGLVLAVWVLYGRIEDLHAAAGRDRRVSQDPLYVGPDRRARR